jgi:hypothetical protein
MGSSLDTYLKKFPAFTEETYNPILSHFNPIHIFIPYLFKNRFNIIIPPTPCLRTCLFSWALPTDMLYFCRFSTTRATCTNISSLFIQALYPY